MKFDLYNFQRVGVDLLKSRNRFLLADSMGCGKTVQVIEAVRELGEHQPKYNTLILCRASLVLMWKEALEKAYGDEAEVIEIKTAKTQVTLSKKYRFVIASFNYIRKDWPRLSKVKWHTIVADEFQDCKNKNSQTAKAFYQLVKGYTGKVWLLTGTPAKTKGEDYWMTLDILEPGKWGTLWDFKFKYCEKVEDRWGIKWKGVRQDRREDLNKAFKRVSIRRLKEKVLKDLPPKVFQDIPISCNVVASLIDEETGMFASGMTQAAKSEMQRLGIAKVPDAIEFLMGFDRPVVAFAMHQQVVAELAQGLEKRGKIVGLVTGSQSREDKHEAVAKFQNGETDIIICNHQAGGVGITLTRASDCVFVEFPWSPADYWQCQDRCHRIGTVAESVNIYNLVVKNSYDEQVLKVLKERGEFMREVMGDEAGVGI